MSRRSIHVVVASYDHEGDTLIRAFFSKLRAEGLARRCRCYDLTRPKYPQPENTPENDALFGEISKKMEVWTKRHPARRDTSFCDSYQVITIPYDDKAAL